MRGIDIIDYVILPGGTRILASDLEKSTKIQVFYDSYHNEHSSLEDVVREEKLIAKRNIALGVLTQTWEAYDKRYVSVMIQDLVHEYDGRLRDKHHSDHIRSKVEEILGEIKTNVERQIKSGKLDATLSKFIKGTGDTTHIEAQKKSLKRLWTNLTR